MSLENETFDPRTAAYVSMLPQPLADGVYSFHDSMKKEGASEVELASHAASGIAMAYIEMEKREATRMCEQIFDGIQYFSNRDDHSLMKKVAGIALDNAVSILETKRGAICESLKKSRELELSLINASVFEYGLVIKALRSEMKLAIEKNYKQAIEEEEYSLLTVERLEKLVKEVYELDHEYTFVFPNEDALWISRSTSGDLITVSFGKRKNDSIMVARNTQGFERDDVDTAVKVFVERLVSKIPEEKFIPKPVYG